MTKYVSTTSFKFLLVLFNRSKDFEFQSGLIIPIPKPQKMFFNGRFDSLDKSFSNQNVAAVWTQTEIWIMEFAGPGLATQPHYKAPGDLRVETDQNAVINIGLVRLSPWEWTEVGPGTAK